MKPDLYLKITLTIIAFCLILLTGSQLGILPVSNAYASQYETPIPIGQNYQLTPINPDGSITVRLSNNELDVNLVGIDTNDELDVNIDEIAGGWLSHGGPIPVEIVE